MSRVYVDTNIFVYAVGADSHFRDACRAFLRTMAASGIDDPLQEIFNRLRSSGTNEILLLDKRRRPYKWLRRGDLMRARGSLARAGTLVHDTVTRDATLRDALEAVLIDNAGRVAVTGRRGEYTGVVDMETLINSVHELLEADRLEALEAQHDLEETRADLTHAEQEGDGGERKA